MHDPAKCDWFAVKIMRQFVNPCARPLGVRKLRASGCCQQTRPEFSGGA